MLKARRRKSIPGANSASSGKGPTMASFGIGNRWKCPNLTLFRARNRRYVDATERRARLCGRALAGTRAVGTLRHIRRGMIQAPLLEGAPVNREHVRA